MKEYNWIHKEDRENELVHIIPVDDLMEHSFDKCNCGTYIEDDHIVIHNALDRRELYEHIIN